MYRIHASCRRAWIERVPFTCSSRTMRSWAGVRTLCGLADVPFPGRVGEGAGAGGARCPPPDWLRKPRCPQCERAPGGARNPLTLRS
eukprot:3972315-Pleurochrysis_carterae.AAC.2